MYKECRTRNNIKNNSVYNLLSMKIYVKALEKISIPFYTMEYYGNPKTIEE